MRPGANEVALSRSGRGAQAVATPEPWRRSWLYRAPGETPALLWIVGIHALAAVGLVLLPLPPLAAWPIAAALLWVGGMGTTVAYHRALAHRALVLHPAVETLLVGAAVFNGSGNPLTWVASHRHHHAHSDTERDISSPRQGGFWWSHLRWLWQADQAPPEKLCPDLVRRGFRRWGRLQAPILLLSLCAGLAAWPWVGLEQALAACLWLGPVRLVLALHVQCTVNSLCHLGEVSAEHGSSRNLAWLAVLHMGQGENWHANHHRRPADPRLGRARWQIDTGWWLIVALERLGLARDVRRARATT